jgi:hypothetical protein
MQTTPETPRMVRTSSHMARPAIAVAVFSLCTSFHAQAVDAFDAGTKLLSLDAVSMSGTTYNQVKATVDSYTLLE